MAWLAAIYGEGIYGKTSVLGEGIYGKTSVLGEGIYGLIHRFR